MSALRRRLVPILLCAWLLAASAGVWAADGADEASQTRACVFPAVDLSPSGEYEEYRHILTDLLKTELGNAGFLVLADESWQPAGRRRGFKDADLLSGENLLAVAEEAQADLAVSGFFRLESRQVVLEIKCYDVKARAFVTGVLKTGRPNLSLYNLIDTAVREMLPEIRLIGKAPAVPEPPSAKEITLLSPDEGMEVSLAGAKRLGAISEGKLILPPIPFPIGSRITVEKKKEGFHLSRESLLVKEPVQQFKLRPLRRKTKTATELNWTVGQLAGFGLAQRYYLNPDIMYLAGEHYFYLQSNFAGDHPVLHNDIKALFGGYLFSGPDSALRLNLSTGAGFILTYFSVPGQGAYVDFYLNIVNVSFELNLRRWALFWRGEAKYALGIGKSLLSRGWLNMAGGLPPMTVGFMWKW